MSKIESQSLIRRYAKARLARDARFDGVFFVAVRSTGIYCRPICPANQPLERNVEYHPSAISAAKAGFRPCLRCRPDSAPHSCAWQGNTTTFERGLDLIQQGALHNQPVTQLAERLGVSDRYLRELFQNRLGTSPKKYAIYQQCLFAKKLLHESGLTITEIAFAAGFNSVRRFNEAMKQQIGLAPRDIRKQNRHQGHGLTLKLYYRPPYAWQNIMAFLQSRVIDGLEWSTDGGYGRTISYQQTEGYFEVTIHPSQHRFDLSIYLSDYQHLRPITQRVRTLFDVDAPIAEIDKQLSVQLRDFLEYQPGLRIPGIWSTFEAGVRAVLGQQVSVSAAQKLVTLFVQNLGKEVSYHGVPASYLFPEPKVVVNDSLDFFRMPQSRKDTIRRLAKHFLTASDPDDIDDWLALKGIGPWTINYVKLRAGKDPDVWLLGDAGIKNAIKLLGGEPNLELTRPWRSYVTFQMWNQL